MMSGWRYSESPLVDGDKVIVTPGSSSSTLVALDRLTGKVIWRCAAGDISDRGADGAGYSSAVIAQVGRVRMYIQQYGRGVIGVHAGTGKLLWSYDRVANGTANITTPVVKEPYVFVSNAYGSGSACLKITATGDTARVEEIRFIPPRTFQNHHGGVVAVGGYIYGGHGQNAGAPTCIELATGKVMWQAAAPARGSASVLCADGKLIFRYEDGQVALIAASPSGFRLLGKFAPPPMAGPAWAHPVVLDGRLYLRHNDVLLCYDVRQK
jgi:outer membrane protein assembly factor BamB